MVAVATRVDGFTTLVGLLPAFAFHIVASILGLQLLRMSARRGETAAAPAEA